MAKKKKDESFSGFSQDESIDHLLSETTKGYGEGIFVSGDVLANEKKIIIPSCPSIDIATSGGFQEGSFIGITGHEKLGKSLPLYATVYTPNGPVRMGDIKVGDIVCSKFKNEIVEGVYPQGERDVYRIHFENDDFVDCDIEHLWPILYKGKDYVVPTHEIIDLIKDESIVYIPICPLTYFETKKTTINPYLYGRLCGFFHRNIDDRYLYNSRDNRIKLLQGLLDASGTCYYTGVVEFYSKNTKLVDSFKILINSLGFTNRRIFRNDIICFDTPQEYGSDIFKLNRRAKRIADKAPKNNYTKLKILSIDYLGRKDCQCISVSGKEKLYVTDNFVLSHNTSLALKIAANAQRPEFGNRPVFYGNVEGRISKMHLTGVQGLKLNKPHFYIIRSVKGKILSASEHLDIYINILKTVPNAVVIIDSISCLCDEKELNEGVTAETRGGGAKLFSRFCRNVNQVVPVNNSIVIGITHLICDSGNAMAGKQERAARMWKYQCDYQLKANYKEAWMGSNSQIGQKVFWTCNCSKLGPPGMKVESYLRYGTGFDSTFEAIQFGITAGLIKKAGSWLSLEFLKDHLFDWNEEIEKSTKVQGGEKVYQLLKQHPEWEEILLTEVLKLTGVGCDIDVQEGEE